MLDRQRGKLFDPASKKWIGAADDEPTDFKLGQACEDRIEVAFSVRMQDMEPQPKRARYRLHFSRLGLDSGTGWIDEQRHDGGFRQHLVQEFKPFWPYLHG